VFSSQRDGEELTRRAHGTKWVTPVCRRVARTRVGGRGTSEIEMGDDWPVIRWRVNARFQVRVRADAWDVEWDRGGVDQLADQGVRGQDVVDQFFSAFVDAREVVRRVHLVADVPEPPRVAVVGMSEPASADL
jgi:hypothetical protein